MARSQKCIEEIKLLQTLESVYDSIKLGNTSLILKFAVLMERWQELYGGFISRLSVDETMSFNSLEAYYLKHYPHSTGGPVIQAFRRAGKKYGEVGA